MKRLKDISEIHPFIRAFLSKITHMLKTRFKTKNTGSTERRKSGFPKELVRNANLHKPLNIIKTTQE